MNKTLPDRVVIYRDGVGDGQVREDLPSLTRSWTELLPLQLHMVVEHEVPQMIDAFKAASSGYK